MTSDDLVLVADPDRDSRNTISRALTEAGFRVMEAADGPQALRQAFSDPPAATVLSLSIPMLSGIELTKVLRAASDMAILVLTDNYSSQLAVRLLDAGADDFLDASVPLTELVARVRSNVRRLGAATLYRSDTSESDLVRTGALVIDPDSHVVLRRGEEVPMTRIEYLLLAALARRLGQVVQHRDLLMEVWGTEYLEDTHYLRGYVASLRGKLEDDPAKPRLLMTEWGVGYRLAALPVEAQDSGESRDTGDSGLARFAS